MRRIRSRYVVAMLSAGALLLPATAPPATGADPVAVGTNNVFGNPTPQVVLAENQARLSFQFHVELDNTAGGAITHVSATGARTRIGSVERPASATVAANDGFWASKYSRAVNGNAGHVLATSVYVLRLKTGPEQVYDPRCSGSWPPAPRSACEDWTTRLLNLRPDRYLEADHNHWLADTVYTDIPGGSGVFGGDSSPPVGSPVSWYDDAQRAWRPIADYFRADPTRPAPPKFRFSVYKPVTDAGTPSYLEFENWAAGDTVGGVRHDRNGRILLGYPGQAARHVADVMQRVRGTGKFNGTEFAHIGQVDTNHPGAFTLSTSPYDGFSWDPEVRGGLQIVPANHVKWLSYGLDQDSFIGKPQWLIVGPVGASAGLLAREVPYTVNGKLSVSPGWEAIAPLFGMYVRTSFDPGDLASSTRFVISTDHGATWRQSPDLTGVNDPSNCTAPACVHNWTNLRVYLSYPEGP